MKITKYLTIVATPMIFLGLAPASNAQYINGFTWDRSTAWDISDNVNNTTTGQPDDDAEGNPVWGYTEASQSDSNYGGLSGPDPWYEAGLDLMEWDSGDSQWEGSFNRVIQQAQLGITGSGRPVFATWDNPTGSAITVDITGTVTFTKNINEVGGAQFALVQRTTGGTNTLLDSADWTTGVGVGDTTANFNISATGIVVAAGDQLLFGMREYGTNANRFWYTDDDLTVTVVPEPSSYAVIVGLIGLGFAIWGRRRS